jgi:hypothetical protein
VGPYQQLIDLVRTREGAEAEAHGRRHMDTSRDLLLRGLESVRVHDVIGQDAPTKLGSSDASVAGAADCLARGHWIGQQILTCGTLAVSAREARHCRVTPGHPAPEKKILMVLLRYYGYSAR